MEENGQKAVPEQETDKAGGAEKKLSRAEKKALRKEKVRQKRAARNLHVRLIPANKKGYHINRFMNFLRFLLYPVHFIFYPYKLHGHTKVGKGACIYFGNHYCIYDIFYPARTTREGIHYLAKQSILEAPVLSYWGSRMGAIGAMRDGADVRTVMESIKVLKNGEKLSLFPEGTRNKTGGDDFLPFHGGAALLAIKTRSPIVPFVICNRPHPFHITHVVFGEPFELSEYYGRKLTPSDYEEADEKLRQKLYDMRAEFRASRGKRKKNKA